MLCKPGADTRPDFVIWGDSHAGDLIPALDSTGRAGLLAGNIACPPLLGVTRRDRGGSSQSADFDDGSTECLQAHPASTTVVLAVHGSISAEGLRFKMEQGGPVFLADEQTRSPDYDENPPVFSRGLGRTLAKLQAAGKRTVIVGPIPEAGWEVPAGSWTSSPPLSVSIVTRPEPTRAGRRP